MSVPLSNYPPSMTPNSEAFDERALDDFISEEELSRLLERGQAQRDGGLLRLGNGRRYVLVEAVRILGNVSQETDPYGMTGTTDTLANMLKRGFAMSSGRVVLGRQIYDAEHGYLPQLIGNPDASGVNPAIR